jgi:hypothetical protein
MWHLVKEYLRRVWYILAEGLLEGFATPSVSARSLRGG